MSDADDTMDSRTSSVGRKRPHEETMDAADMSQDEQPDNEAQEVPRKRTRAAHSPSSRSTSPQPAQPLAKSGGWNKGVRSAGAIRTTLGGGKSSLLARFGSTSGLSSLAASPEPQEAVDDDASMPYGSRQASKQNEVEMADYSRTGRAVVENPSASTAPAIGKNHGQDISSTQPANSFPSYVDKVEQEITITQPQRKLSKKARKAALLLEQQEESRKLVEQSREDSKRLVEQSSLSDRHKTKLLGLDPTKITKSSLRIFGQLPAAEKAFLSPMLVEVFDKEKEKRAEASRLGKLAAAERKASLTLPTTLRDRPLLKTPPAENKDAPTEKDEGSAEEGDSNEESEDESGQIPDDDVSSITPQSILANMTDRELELQLKYFPTPDGAVSMPRCLSCTQSDHATLNCPYMTCETCGKDADHGASACPHKEICTRCREQGHGVGSCSQKLARSVTEQIACNLCHKLSHDEKDCDLLWRTYEVPSQNVKMIKPPPMDCYFCGGSGHVGPQCGLRPEKEKLNCSYTFTRENHSRYSDANVSNKAVGTGKDYTVPPRNKPAFNIRGKASEVITIDDSDEEMDGFIHTKVESLPGHRQIQVGNIGSGLPRYDRGMDMHSAFANDRNAPIMPARTAVESSRYGRERSFSPPPRYNDRYPPPYNDRGNNGYQTRSQQQPPLPRGPPPLPHGPPPSLPARGGKGGRGGRGGGRGGSVSHARNPAPPPHKTNSNAAGGGKKKQRNRRGKN